MDDITLRQLQVVSPAVVTPRDGAGPARPSPTGPSFGEVLQDYQERGEAAAATLGAGALGSLKFSMHAQTRLQSRSIPFGPEEVARLEAAVGKAQAKGSRESLVLMDGVALVVSVKNRTVITAVDAASLKNNVFTNIDSAIIC